MNDEYLTITEGKIGEGYYTEKRSKFLAFSHHVSTTDEIKTLIGFYKKKYYDSRHVCYGADRAVFRANDDGEPSGTGGKPILGQINSNVLTDILVVVVRYYYWFICNLNKYVLLVLSIILLLNRNLIDNIATPFMINNAVYWLGFFILGNLYGKKLIEILCNL